MTPAQLQEQSDMDNAALLDMAAEIVSAYVRHNPVPSGELPGLLISTHATLAKLMMGAQPAPEPVKCEPAVSIKKSVTDEAITCLDCGKRFKSLKRHLHSEHEMSPQDYKTKWGLAKEYPMVAAAYAASRSNLAKTMGLGRKASNGAAGHA